MARKDATRRTSVNLTSVGGLEERLISLRYGGAMAWPGAQIHLDCDDLHAFATALSDIGTTG